MRKLSSMLLALTFVIISGMYADAKKYTRKAERPGASDHTWSGCDYDFNIDENGYSYIKKNDNTIHPIIGKKIVGDTTFVHYKEIPGKPKHYEESGFYVGNDYYIIKETAYQSNIAIDYSHAKSDGYAVIRDKNGEHYAALRNDEPRHCYTSMSFESLITGRDVDYDIFKEVDTDGQTTVSSDNTDELSPQAKEFIHFAEHPYVKATIRLNFL